MNTTQAAFDFARNDRDAGMNLVADRAGEDWKESAYRSLINFAENNTKFMTEDARLFAERNGVPRPHDNRAWGIVVVRAIKAGIIKRCNYAPSKTGHMRPMPVWSSAIFTG